MPSRISDYLPRDANVGGYRIVSVVSAGGFGILYRAEALGRRTKAVERQLGPERIAVPGSEGVVVALKEFFPFQLAHREGSNVVTGTDVNRRIYDLALQKFVTESQRLILLFDHPTIVRGLELFAHNNTYYFAMEYIEGETLTSWLERHLRETGQPPSEAELKTVLEPLLDALKTVHDNEQMHRDIKPDNIMLRKNGQPVLIDFGLVGEGLNKAREGTLQALTPGYAPPEQLGLRGTMHQGSYVDLTKQGAYSDIYALAAVVLRSITNSSPPDADERLRTSDSGNTDPVVATLQSLPRGRYSEIFLGGLRDALELNPAKRPQSMDVFAERLGWRGISFTQLQKRTLPIGLETDATIPLLPQDPQTGEDDETHYLRSEHRSPPGSKMPADDETLFTPQGAAAANPQPPARKPEPPPTVFERPAPAPHAEAPTQAGIPAAVTPYPGQGGAASLHTGGGGSGSTSGGETHQRTSALKPLAVAASLLLVLGGGGYFAFFGGGSTTGPATQPQTATNEPRQTPDTNGAGGSASSQQPGQTATVTPNTPPATTRIDPPPAGPTTPSGTAQATNPQTEAGQQAATRIEPPQQPATPVDPALQALTAATGIIRTAGIRAPRAFFLDDGSMALAGFAADTQTAKRASDRLQAGNFPIVTSFVTDANAGRDFARPSQVAATVCDNLALPPDHPARPDGTVGRRFQDINASVAIAACSTFVNPAGARLATAKEYDPRFTLNLALATLKSGDQARAQSLFDAAAKAGDPYARTYRAWLAAGSASPDMAAIVADHKAAAEQGVGASLMALASLAGSQIPGAPSASDRDSLLRQAAAAGVPAAMTALGMSARDNGDRLGAETWLRQAADFGSAVASDQLASLLGGTQAGDLRERAASRLIALYRQSDPAIRRAVDERLPGWSEEARIALKRLLSQAGSRQGAGPEIDDQVIQALARG